MHISRCSPRVFRFLRLLAWGLWLGNIVIITGVWASHNLVVDTSLDGAVLIALARLLGLLAAFSALTQLVLMGRAGWLEPLFGMDKLAIFHRLNGYATIIFILLHSILMSMGYAAQASLDIVGQFTAWLNAPFFPYIPLAMLAELLFITVVGASIYIVRKHLKFESWYTVHLLTYAAIALASFHQLVLGADVADGWFRYYWLGLYAFAVITVLVWRFGKPLWLYKRHHFKVEKVVAETASATSVYVTGRNLERFTAVGGQFILVRFWDRQLRLQEHPFSLSMLPNAQHLRITVRQLGDFTNSLPHVQPGTPVIISGPHGAFTKRLITRSKVLFIAGGIGITPIRSMLEEAAGVGQSQDAVLLYGNRSVADTVFGDELANLATQLHMPIHMVYSDDPSAAGGHGYVDQQKIAQLVPDVAERDILLCGPPPMMKGVIAALKALGVPAGQIHFERFSLHK